MVLNVLTGKVLLPGRLKGGKVFLGVPRTKFSSDTMRKILRLENHSHIHWYFTIPPISAMTQGSHFSLENLAQKWGGTAPGFLLWDFKNQSPSLQDEISARIKPRCQADYRVGMRRIPQLKQKWSQGQLSLLNLATFRKARCVTN